MISRTVWRSRKRVKSRRYFFSRNTRKTDSIPHPSLRSNFDYSGMENSGNLSILTWSPNWDSDMAFHCVSLFHSTLLLWRLSIDSLETLSLPKTFVSHISIPYLFSLTASTCSIFIPHTLADQRPRLTASLSIPSNKPNKIACAMKRVRQIP